MLVDQMISLILAILILGLSGIIAQILLLRELLITFYGNELSIGIILANWLILVAIGSVFLGKWIEGIKNKAGAFVGLTLLFSLSFPFLIYLARIWKTILKVTPGEGLGLVSMFFSSFIILLPVGILHGALFTFGCKIFSLCRPQAKEVDSIAKVYIYETLGTIAGGIFFTYILLIYLESFQIALLVGLLNTLVCIFLLKQTFISRILQGVSIVLFVFYGYLLLTSKTDRIHNHSIKRQWQSQNIIYYQNSIYGNVAVTKRAKQYTFFLNGVPIITTPIPDIAFIEEFAHLPLLFHSKPKEILIISGGVGGLINEVLKHPVERIDYLELDPLILKAVKRFATPLTKNELADTRVKIHYIDGRLFVKKSTNRYDLVLVGFSNPNDLQTNRFFTREFFSLVKDRLKKGGILVIRLPGSLTYLGKELKHLNICILNTLKGVYPYLRVIPGDGTNLFLASASQDLSLVDDVQLNKRFKERNLKTSFLTPAYIEYKLDKRWLSWFLKSIEGGGEKENQDFRPLGVFYSLSYWNAIFSPKTQKAFSYFEGVNIKLVSILLSIFVFPFIFLHFKVKDLSGLSIPFAITCSGFAGMIFNLALVFTFQALYGFVFHWIGILTSASMVGVTIGSLAMTFLIKRIKRDIPCFLGIEVAIIIFSGILPLVFIKFSPYLDKAVVFSLLQVVFLALSVFGGILIGAQFPLANKICLKRWANLGKTAGLLYSCDLFGGFLGGIIGGVVFLPILGLLETCLLVVILKITSLIIVSLLNF